MEPLQHQQYKISGDPILTKALYNVPDDLFDRLSELHERATNRLDKKISNELRDLIDRYPRVPVLRNFLFKALRERGKHRMAENVNNEMLALFPGYLFARLNKAREHIFKNEFDKVPELLGPGVEIGSLYPERKEFHLSEFTAFYETAVFYFLVAGEIEEAETRLDILKKAAPDADETDRAKNAFNRVVQARKVEENEPRYPEFENPVVLSLYENGTEIDPQILREILSLPAESAVRDLLLILEDAESRFWEAEREEDPALTSYVFHALMLLGDIASPDALDGIRMFLCNEEEVVYFWLGDHHTETLWQTFFKIGRNNPAVLYPLLVELALIVTSRSIVSHGLSQIALHYPERKPEVVAVYEKVFEHYLTFSDPDVHDLVLDDTRELVGLLVCDTIDAGLKELMPMVRRLFEAGRVALTMTGPLNHVEKLYDDPASIWKWNIEPVEEIYRRVEQSWVLRGSGSRLYDEEPDDKVDIPDQKRVGRNDPCPCGSGKKFKKCCMVG